MRPFDRTEAERYVARWRPLDSAGGYRIEDAGIALFERIESADFTGIVGLPLLAVARLLRAAGLLPA
jgi:septum formation protein